MSPAYCASDDPRPGLPGQLVENDITERKLVHEEIGCKGACWAAVEIVALRRELAAARNKRDEARS